MRPFLAIVFLLCLAPPTLADMPVHAEPKANLTILVDENLMLPATALARAYAKVSNTPLTIVVKDPGEAEDEIEQGLEAHVLLTANRELVGRLTEQGLTDVSSSRAVADTHLALVASTSLGKQELLAKHISFAAMLYATPDVPIFIESTASEAGQRANALMKGYEFSPQLAARAQSKASRDEVLAALSATPALGLMLVPDALAQPDLVVLSALPEAISPAVQYEAVILASESMIDARQFVDFLQSPPAQKILSHDGYTPISRR